MSIMDTVADYLILITIIKVDSRVLLSLPLCLSLSLHLGGTDD